MKRKLITAAALTLAAAMSLSSLVSATVPGYSDYDSTPAVTINEGATEIEIVSGTTGVAADVNTAALPEGTTSVTLEVNYLSEQENTAALDAVAAIVSSSGGAGLGNGTALDIIIAGSTMTAAPGNSGNTPAAQNSNGRPATGQGAPGNSGNTPAANRPNAAGTATPASFSQVTPVGTTKVLLLDQNNKAMTSLKEVVTFTVPVPAGVNAISYINADGKLVILRGILKDGFFTFETKFLGDFIFLSVK